jgi:signal transduction histidine kinase
MLSPAHIAIIDDDDDVRDALAQLLRGVGYQVVGYNRADRALVELESADATDLIVLDLRLPGMNGWNFRVEQKKRKKLSEVPVIALSADASPFAKAIDADAYLTKPVDFSELEAVIGRVLLANERRRLLARSMELERIRALGTLVATVAHEINNPLTYVMTCLELASSQVLKLNVVEGPGLPATVELSRNLADATDGATRIASVVKLLSTFSRADAAASDDVDVLRAVQAASRLARHQIARGTRFREELAAVPRARGNEGRLAQVVLNLLVNAAHAVSSSDGETGQILVVTRDAGASILIEVSDTGPGIEPALLEKIFEPFFTTKPAGMGTGLGLSISRDIIRGMGGSLTVRSVLGEGATFTIALPVAKGAQGAQEHSAPQPEPEEATRVSRRILVVDDEPMIGRVVKAALSRDIVEVSLSPHDALKLATTSSYDVILCDFKMPEMTGLEFYRELVEARPDLQSSFVLMTGSRDDAEIGACVRTRRMRVLFKPFSVATLEQCLNGDDAGHDVN